MLFPGVGEVKDETIDQGRMLGLAGVALIAQIVLLIGVAYDLDKKELEKNEHRKVSIESTVRPGAASECGCNQHR